jgi:hypothetical protein
MSFIFSRLMRQGLPDLQYPGEIFTGSYPGGNFIHETFPQAGTSAYHGSDDLRTTYDPGDRWW